MCSANKFLPLVVSNLQESRKLTEDKDRVKSSSSKCRSYQCQRSITADSVYCSDECLQQYVSESISHLSKDSQALQGGQVHLSAVLSTQLHDHLLRALSMNK